MQCWVLCSDAGVLWIKSEYFSKTLCLDEAAKWIQVFKDERETLFVMIHMIFDYLSNAWQSCHTPGILQTCRDFSSFYANWISKKIHDKYNFLRTHGSISEPEVLSCTVSLYLFFAACLLLTLLLLASYFWGFEVSLYFRCRSSFMLRSAVKRDLSLFNALHVGSPVTATWCWRPPTCCWGTSWWGLCWRSATCWRWPTSLAWVVLSWW